MRGCSCKNLFRKDNKKTSTNINRIITPWDAYSISEICHPPKLLLYLIHIPTFIVSYAASSEDLPGIEDYLQAISLLKGDEPCGSDFW